MAINSNKKDFLRMTAIVNEKVSDDEVLERLKREHYEKSVKIQNLAKKSFIMNEGNSKQSNFKNEGDSSLHQYLSKIKKIKDDKKKMENASIFSKDFWIYNISNNLDLFSTLFIDSNLLLVIYPLNTIKTRIQAQHKYEDVSYFIRNRVSEKRNSFIHKIKNYFSSI